MIAHMSARGDIIHHHQHQNHHQRQRKHHLAAEDTVCPRGTARPPLPKKKLCMNIQVCTNVVAHRYAIFLCALDVEI